MPELVHMLERHGELTLDATLRSHRPRCAPPPL